MPTSSTRMLEQLGLLRPRRGPIPRMQADNRAYHYPLPPEAAARAALPPQVTADHPDRVVTVVIDGR